MASPQGLGKVIETDVLVVGGGPTGFWAANRAKEFAERVTVIDKGPKDWGGLASMSGGGIIALLPGEDVDECVKELVYYYDGLCQQDLLEEILKRSPDIIQNYMRLGFELIRESNGALKGIPQRGLKHIKCYVGMPFGKGGKNMVQVLVNEATRLGVERLGRILITDLLKSDGAVVGAIGFDTITGEFYTVKAPAVIVATGHGGWKASYHMNTATGEGTEMVFRAGAGLSNFEFARVWNVPALFAWEGQTWLLPLGAKYVNAKGEPFMDKYSPILGSNADPHFVCRAMAVEAREGRGPFYFDCTPLKPQDRELMVPKGGWMKLNHEKLLKIGMNFFEQKLEWMPQLRQSSGGVKANIDGSTGVPGLFVAGRARSLDPTPYMGGWNLLMTAVTGRIAGESAAKYASSCQLRQIDGGEVRALKSRLYASLGKAGISYKEVLREIQRTVFPYDVCILKSEPSLKKAVENIQKIRNGLLPQMGAKDAHYLMKSVEVRGILLVTELFLRSSLMRTESRAGHYREDCPGRDNKNWLKWIIVEHEDGEYSFRTEPVPLEKYKFKPTRYYSDNFTFPDDIRRGC